MIVGVIKTKDIFFHPVTIIQMKGWLGFLAVLRQAMSYKSYRFINFIGSATRGVPQ